MNAMEYEKERIPELIHTS